MLALMLAVAAGICLAVGWLLEQIALVSTAFGLSAAGLLLVALPWWQKRRQANREFDEAKEENPVRTEGSPCTDDSADADEPSGAGGAPGAEPDSADDLPQPTPLRQTRPSAEGQDLDAVLVNRSTSDRLDEQTPVHVLQARKRFHVAECRLVENKDSQELTLVEAQEETFTPCSLCIETGGAPLLSRHG